MNNELKRHMRIPYFILLLAIIGCGTSQTEEQTIWIGPRIVDCVGVGPTKCMQVKFTADGEWMNFYSKIEGFKHKKGHNYKIIVEVIGKPNVPADDASLRYVLVKIEQDYTGSSASKGEFAARPDLYTKKWRLKSYTLNGVIKKVTAKFDVSLEVDQSTHKVNGVAACNTYFGQAVINGSEFSVTGLGSTRKMCAETELMELEGIFLKLLGEVVSIPPNRSIMMTLMTPSGDEMTFMPDAK